MSFTSLHITSRSVTLKSVSLTSAFFQVPEGASNCPLFPQDSQMALGFPALSSGTANMMRQHSHDYAISYGKGNSTDFSVRLLIS